MSEKSEQARWSKRDRKQSKRRHGMRVDRRPTDIGNALTKRVRKEDK